MHKKFVKYQIILVLFLIASVCEAQIRRIEEESTPTTRILFVFDGSQSMYARWQSDVKINIARRLLSNILDSLKSIENLEIALRVYGHQHNYPPQHCDDTRLEVPFGDKNVEQIKHRLKAINPKGTTPIAFALQKAGNDFTECDNCRNIIVLITDGIEECGGDPCEVSKELQKQGLILKPFIIGIGRDFSHVFNCVGTYFDASSEVQFQKALDIVISQALNSTTAQVNLLDENDKPTETNVNMTFYDSFSGKVKYNFIHTMNNKALPDTLYIDPIPEYNIVVHTIPPVKVDNVKLISGKHTTIPVKVPQGYLKLSYENNPEGMRDLPCIVRLDGDHSTINVQNFGQTEKYLTGIYDLEVLCLPRIYVEDVEVSQSSTTNVSIPMPGIAVIKKTTYGYGSLYQKKGDELIWIYNFREDNPYQESLFLQPGTYKVVFRSKYSDRAIYTLERSFEVEPGKSTNVTLYR